MYIPEFWCGVIAGAVVATSLIVAWSVWYDRKCRKINEEIKETIDFAGKTKERRRKNEQEN